MYNCNLIYIMINTIILIIENSLVGIVLEASCACACAGQQDCLRCQVNGAMIVEKVTGDSGPCVTSFMECKLELFQKAYVTPCRTAPLRKRYPIVGNSYLQLLTIEIQLEIDFLGTILPIECIRTN